MHGSVRPMLSGKVLDAAACGRGGVPTRACWVMSAAGLTARLVNWTPSGPLLRPTTAANKISVKGLLRDAAGFAESVG